MREYAGALPGNAVTDDLLKLLLYVCLYVIRGVVGTFAVVVTVVLTMSSLLVVLLLLQATGLAPRVPLGYNFRNLVVRWRITAADRSGLHAGRRR